MLKKDRLDYIQQLHDMKKIHACTKHRRDVNGCEFARAFEGVPDYPMDNTIDYIICLRENQC